MPVTLETLALTGGAVPGHAGVTFRFFDAPTLFDDGEIFFEGVTTLTGTSNTGLYRAPAEGSLGAVVQNGDTALASFDFTIVPAFQYRANAAKDVVFDGRIPSLGFWEMRAGAVFSHHPGGSQSIVSGITGVPHIGFFSTPTSWEFNDADVTLFKTKFDSINGLFAGLGGVAPRNIAFEGDAVPGIANANFGNLGIKSLASDGTAYFRSVLTGGGVTTGDDETFWMDSGGTLSLLAREGQSAPGLAGHTLTLTDLLLGPTGDFLLWGDAEGATTISAFWTGTNAEDMVPVVQAEGGKSVVTTTDQGDLAFTILRAPTFSANGDLYFIARGNLVSDDSVVGGIWKREATTGAVTLVLRDGTVAPGETFGFSFDWFTFSTPHIVSINTSDKLAFIGGGGIWVRDAAGTFTNIVRAGETLAGRTVTNFTAFDTRLNDNDTVAFIAQFADADGDRFPDEGVFRATLGPRLPTAAFIWSGDVGDGLWHSSPTGPTNWNDLATGQDADRVPGSTTPGEGDSQSVTINGADVTISDTPVTLLSLTATGTLEIDRPLTVVNDSSVENIALDADLTTSGPLSLTGQTNRWTSGVIRGPGKVTLAPGTTTLTLAPANNSTLELRTELAVGGSLVHESGTLDVSLGKISVLQDTTFEIRAGMMVANGAAPHLVNNGTIRKTGPGTADLDVYLKNEPTGRIEIFTGDAVLGGPNILAGTVLTGVATDTSIKGDELATVATDLKAEGTGTLTFSEALFLTDGTTTTLELRGQGKSVIAPDTVITGTGTLQNTGTLEFPGNAQLRTKLTTTGTTTQTGGSITLFGEGAAVRILTGGTHVLEGNTSLRREPTGSGFVTLDGGTLSKSGTDSTSTIENELRFKGGTVDANQGSLLLPNKAVVSDNTTTISGSGTVTTAELQIDSGSLTNELTNGGSLILTLGAKTNGGKLTNRGKLSWVNGIITGGTITGGTVTNGVKNLTDATLVTESPVSLQDGVIDNAGGTITLLNALAISDATLVNRADSTLELGPLAQINTIEGKTGNIINNTGTLKNSGAGTSEIRTGYEGDRGKFEIASGTLKLSSPVTLRNNNEATMTAGTTLEFDTDNLTLEANAKLETNGPGTLRIHRDFTLESGSQLLTTDATNTILDGTQITGTGKIYNAGNLVIEKSGAAVPTPKLDTLLDDRGELTIRSPLESSSGSAKIKSLGKLFLDAPSRTIEVAPPITSLFGEITATANTNATIGLTNLNRLLLRITTARIDETTLTLEDGAILTIVTPDFPDLAPPEISQIMEEAIVTIRGSGSVNNLPADAGSSFWLFGDLNLRDGATWSGQAFTVFQEGSLDVGPGCTMTINCLDILNSACNAPLSTSLGNIRIDGTVNVTGSGTSALSSQTLVNGTLSFANSANDSLLILRSGGDMTVNGSLTSPRILIENTVDISGTGTINSALVQNSGDISPGNSAGVLTIAGELAQTSNGSLVIDLESPTPGSGFDQLVVNGPASISGSLDLEIASGFLLPNNTTITILSATSLSGRFNNVFVNGRSGRQKLTVGYTPTAVILTSQVASVSNFNGWRSALFTPAEQIDPAISAPNADSDNDNLDTLLEYVFDTDPKRSNQSPLHYEFETDENGKPTRLIATFPWAKGMTDVTWKLQISDDFNSWLPLNATTVSTENQGLVDRLTVSAPMDANTSPEQSIRLEVTTTGG